MLAGKVKELLPIWFAYDLDPGFDEKISYALRRKCEDLTVIKKDFERISVYLKHEQTNVAGAICYVLETSGKSI